MSYLLYVISVSYNGSKRWSFIFLVSSSSLELFLTLNFIELNRVEHFEQAYF